MGLTTRDLSAELLQAMAECGLRPQRIIWDGVPDGPFHRFPGIGQTKGDNGFYKAFVDQRGAVFGDWRTKEQWNWPQDDPKWKAAVKHLEPLSAAEVEKRKREAAEARAKAAERHTRDILDMWARAKDCRNHPYLEAKGIRNVTYLKSIIDPETEEEMLLIPMRNVQGKIRNIQRIWPNGRRRQMPQAGGSTGLYNTIEAHRFKHTKTLYVCEGWATGWTIHLATNTAVIVAFFDGGLKTVGEIIQSRYPDANLIFAADNDRWKPVKREGQMVNPGVYAAVKAAEALDAEYCIPDFADLETKPTDFDDLRQLEGLDAVRARLDPDLAGDAVTSIEEPAADVADESAYIRRRDLPDLQARFMVDPGSLAHRLLDRMAAKLLVVTKSDGDTTALMALPCGRWSNSPDPWRRALRRELKSMTSDLMDLVGNDVTVAEANRRMNRIHQVLRYLDKVTESVRAACSSAYAVEMEPYIHSDTFHRPRFVQESELDADLNVMGFENGVVDLRTGKLLDPVYGADRFVTASTGIDYRSDAEHEAVDRLFAHLEPDLRRFWTEALAWALRGRPSRRMYLAVGPPQSGKTTIAVAVRRALGNTYSANLKGDALCVQRGDAAHSGVSVFGQPARVVTVEEPKTAKVDVSLVKSLTGGGEVTVRKLHHNPFEILSTATLFMFSNPGQSVPRLGLADEAMADRLRELPYPAVPVVDPDFVHAITSDRGFREALLARLIAIGANLSGPPRSPDSVKAATQLRAQLDLTPFEEFLQRFVPGHPDDVLRTEHAWSEWCDFVGEDVPTERNRKVNGYSKAGFSMAIGRRVPGIPKTASHRIGGSFERGWKGWRLESA